MDYDVEFWVVIGISIVVLFGILDSIVYYGEKEIEQKEQFYNLIMANEIEFVDGFIETNKTTKFKIVYRENGEIKEQNVNLQQYYEIIEKCKKE